MKPTDFGVMTIGEIEEFSSKVDRSGDCWIYLGSLYDNGYGRVWIGALRKHIRAHRLAFFLWVDRSLEQNVLHSCDNPPCVNPDHLRAGSKQDNVDDMWVRGRAATALMLPHTRLSDEDVVYVRSMRGIKSGQELADEFGVRRSHIYRIWSGKRRARVTS